VSRPRQYKGKIKQWGLDTKYTKTEEYMEILKTKKEIEEKNKGKGKSKEKDGDGESSSTGSFTVRGKTVSDSSITRFERRAKKRGIIPADDTGDAGGSGSGRTDYADSSAGGSSADYQGDFGALGPSYDTAGGYQGYDAAGYSQGYFPNDYQTGDYSGSGYQGEPDPTHVHPPAPGICWAGPGRRGAAPCLPC